MTKLYKAKERVVRAAVSWYTELVINTGPRADYYRYCVAFNSLRRAVAALQSAKRKGKR